MKTETVLIIGAVALIFGAPLLKALAGGQDQDPMGTDTPPGAVLDPFGGPTRVQDPLAIPTATPEPVFSQQVIGGDVVTNDFIPHEPDVPPDGADAFLGAAAEGGKWFLNTIEFGINPIGSTIDGILSIF
ncbi:MAG: hypothetical protein IIA92_13760 [Chloroflexi bacterium]|nr:hypothetical protein [Chloroflexota bacterium]